MKLLITGAFNWTVRQKEYLQYQGFELIYIDREDGELCLNPKEGDNDLAID